MKAKTKKMAALLMTSTLVVAAGCGGGSETGKQCKCTSNYGARKHD